MWAPIADPGMSRRCWSAIEEIERGLVEPRETDQDPVLASGKAGQALFFSSLHAAGGLPAAGSGAADRALAALGQSIDALAESHLSPALYTGFCGVGWAVEHLTGELFDRDEDLCGALDEALGDLLANPAAAIEADLISGLAGYGTYLLERLPNPAAAGLLVRVVDLLDAAAETSEAGTAWHTSPGGLATWQRELMPEGCHDLGMAHGIPGVIGFLAAARRQGIDDPRVPRLAAGAVRWLLGQKLPQEMGSVFPSMLPPGLKPEPSRTAWCTGDLGIAVALLAAARSFGRLDWEEEALSLARLVARRPQSRTVDSSLCHGTAGNGHLFNRLYQATGDPEMKEAALAWYGLTLDRWHPGEGFAGFQTWVVSRPGIGDWEGRPGFLIGAAGVGLSLLAAVTDIEPVWDRVMLTSIPPRPGDSPYIVGHEIGCG
jgi:lantibiotic modifying enzyme